VTSLMCDILRGCNFILHKDTNYYEHKYVVKLESKIKSLEAQNEILKSSLGKIKQESLDDKTPERYIRALQSWRSSVCAISFKALKQCEGLENKWSKNE
jgi:hypothetical protein